jgi:hypothetical protein
VNTFWGAIASGALRGAEPERKRWKITMRDDNAEHQIRIRLVTGGPEIAVSCVCRDRAGEGPLAARTRWEPDEPIALWREHMAAASAA